MQMKQSHYGPASLTPGNGPISNAKTGLTSKMMLDVDRIYAKLLEAGNEWADKQSAADLLEETRKIVLAERILAADAKSHAQAETMALTSPQYKEHVVAMNAARRAANRARVNYDAVKTLTELRRSQESTRRAEAAIR